jgi:hypothetical protein
MTPLQRPYAQECCAKESLADEASVPTLPARSERPGMCVFVSGKVKVYESALPKRGTGLSLDCLFRRRSAKSCHGKQMSIIRARNSINVGLDSLDLTSYSNYYLTLST